METPNLLKRIIYCRYKLIFLIINATLRWKERNLSSQNAESRELEVGCYCVGVWVSGYFAVEGGPEKIYVGEKCMFSGSAPNQTYYLLVCPPLHSLNQLFTVCNSLTCSPCRDFGEHVLPLPLREGYGADTVANLAPLQRFNTVYSWKRIFLKVTKNVRIKTELCFVLHFTPTRSTMYRVEGF